MNKPLCPFCGISIDKLICKNIDVTDGTTNNKVMLFYCPSCSKIISCEFNPKIVINGIDQIIKIIS